MVRTEISQTPFPQNVSAYLIDIPYSLHELMKEQVYLNKAKQLIEKNEAIFCIFIGLLFTVIFYPAFFSMQDFPFGQTSWELADPAVSPQAFVPGFRTFKYELLTNGNILWSSLRGLGQPLLGNEVQSAPLFPLTLLLVKVPEPYFWNLLVILRFMLIACGSYLVAFKILKFSRTAAVVFTLVFSFSLFLVRYLNHPYQNGIAAGVWYIYFLCRFSKIGALSKNRLLSLSGLILSVYSLMTSGFPEANLVSAFLVLFIVLPLLIKNITGKSADTIKILLGLVFAHIIGFCIAAIPTFALLEYVKSAGTTFRLARGVNQVSSFAAFAHMITRVTPSHPAGFVIHYFHLTPIFIFISGQFVSRKKLNIMDISALVLGAFYILKTFPLWPAFNLWVGNLPLLSQSHFPQYFFLLLIWSFAHFVARGLDNWIIAIRNNSIHSQKLLLNGTCLFTLLLLYIACSNASPTSAVYAIRMAYLFLAFFAVLKLQWKPERAYLFGVVVCFFITAEIIVARPIHFLKYEDSEYKPLFSHTRGDALRELLVKNGLVPHEVRDRTMFGSYVSGGIASADDGFMAILPVSMTAFRINHFFPTSEGWGGYVPLLKEKFPNTWRALSVSIHEDPPLLPLLPIENKNMRLLGEVEGKKIYYDKNALSRAYIADACTESLETPITQLGTATIQGLTEVEKSFCKKYKHAYERVSIESDQGKELTLKTVNGPAILIQNDFYYPGWKALDTLTGKDLIVHQANSIFRAVLLTEARPYTVQFYYEPSWLQLARQMTLAGLVCFVLLVFAAVIKHFYFPTPLPHPTSP